MSRVWVISVYAAMERYGEAEVTACDVAHTAKQLFPSRVPAGSLGEMIAEIELDQTRKLLAFIREVPHPPSVRDLLKAACLYAGGIMRKHYDTYYVGRKGFERITSDRTEYGAAPRLQAG
jgi:hypothetical protein